VPLCSCGGPSEEKTLKTWLSHEIEIFRPLGHVRGLAPSKENGLHARATSSAATPATAPMAGVSAISSC
jgi:hypothetical protein